MSDPEPAHLERPTREPSRGFGRGSVISPGLSCFFLFVGFLAIALAIHVQGFHSPMIYDSDGWILKKTEVFARHNLLEVIAIVPVRPLFMASLYLNYLATGMDPFWFRFVNATILAAAALVLVMLMIILFDIPGISLPGTRGEKKIVAALAGLIFLVHPLQSFVVLYIWQREAIMACLFYFAALAVYMAGASGRWGRVYPAYACVSALFFLGLLSKENLATVPVMILAAELILFRRNLKDLLRKSLLVALIIVPPLVTYLLLTHNLHGYESVHHQGALERLKGYYELSGLSVLQVVLTECRILFSYLLMILMPFRHAMQLVQPQVVSVSFWDPATTPLAVAGVIALAAASAGLSRRQPLVSYGILFFLITIVPESVLIPQYLYFGYRAILPMAGILLFTAVLALLILDWGRQKSFNKVLKPAMAVIAAVFTGSLVCLTVSRAQNWNPVLFWRSAHSHLPPFSSQVEQTPYRIVMVNLGAVLIDAGEYDAAAQVLRKAYQLDRESPVVAFNLGQALCRTSGINEGKEILKGLLDRHPQMTHAWTVLAQALLDQGNTAEGIAHLRQGVQHNPADPVLRTKLAEPLIEVGNVTEALEHLNSVLRDNPNFVPGRVQMGFAMRKSGNLEEAVKQFTEVLKMDPGSQAALQGLATTRRQMAAAHNSIESFTKAVEADPHSAAAHYELANALLKNGRVDEAIAAFGKSLELKPDFAAASANLGVALLQSGRFAEAAESLTRAVASIKGNAELHNALGVALVRQGKTDDAMRQFREALSINPDHLGARRNLATLESGNDSPVPQTGTR